MGDFDKAQVEDFVGKYGEEWRTVIEDTIAWIIGSGHDYDRENMVHIAIHREKQKRGVAA
jgi:hypothetical protein